MKKSYSKYSIVLLFEIETLIQFTQKLNNVGMLRRFLLYVMSCFPLCILLKSVIFSKKVFKVYESKLYFNYFD